MRRGQMVGLFQGGPADGKRQGQPWKDGVGVG